MCGRRTSTYFLTHLTDDALEHGLAASAGRESTETAVLLAHIVEFDARGLYRRAAHPSMFDYCVHKLRLSDDAAFKRIRAARTARRFPAVFPAVAEGRLHLTAVVLLTPYLTPSNADELLAAAAHKTKSEIEQLLAHRFPRPDVPAQVQAIGPKPELATLTGQLAPEPVDALTDRLAPEPVHALVERSKLKPLAPQRFALQVTIDQDTHDMLRYAQALLGHQVPSGDVAQVLKRALAALIPQLENGKFAATSRPRPSQRRPTAGGRHIPAAVKRAVWERDGGQCTFVSEDGHRCQARRFLEFDHVNPLARGGESTIEGLRLRCRAHNQYAAECTFGTNFMRRKREEAQRAAEERAAAAQARTQADAAVNEIKQDVICALRNLGYRADQARHAAVRCDSNPDATFEERIRVALSFLCPRAASHCRAVRIPVSAT